MTTNDKFGRDLSEWLRSTGEHRVPDHLAEVLVRTAATRQRPWWSSPERWIPMSTIAIPRPAGLRPSIVLAVVVVGLLLAALAAVFVASPRPVPSFGLAQNGLIVATDGTSLKAFQPDGTAPTVLAELEGDPLSVSISPDGRQVAYAIDGPAGQRLLVRTLDSGATVELPGPVLIGADPVSWSPDSTRFTFAGVGLGDEVEHLYIGSADGSSVSLIGDGTIDQSLAIWHPAWSPDGRWISFVGSRAGNDFGDLFLIRPDGTELHAVRRQVSFGDAGAPAWAPDPAVQRLLYVMFMGSGLETRLYDLATDKDYATSLGFWPAWSPDGTRMSACCASVVETADVLALQPDAVTVFAQPEGNCPDLEEYAGRAICGTATWSPDGTKLISVDIAESALLIAPVDGSGPPVRVDLETDWREDARWAWQPIRR